MRYLDGDPDEADPFGSVDAAAHVGDPADVTLRPLWAAGAVVLGAVLAAAGPLVFVLLAIVGLQPFKDKEGLVLVVVVLMSFLVGTALLVSAGFVTYAVTRKTWLVPAPYALALLGLLAGLWLT